jgi:hypothetical protein
MELAKLIGEKLKVYREQILDHRPDYFACMNDITEDELARLEAGDPELPFSVYQKALDIMELTGPVLRAVNTERAELTFFSSQQANKLEL